MTGELPIQRVEVSFVGPPPAHQVKRASGVSEVETDDATLRCLALGYLIFRSTFLPRA
jgi:hypothetical protein